MGISVKIIFSLALMGLFLFNFVLAKKKGGRRSSAPGPHIGVDCCSESFLFGWLAQSSRSMRTGL